MNRHSPLHQPGFGAITVLGLLLLHGPLIALAVFSFNDGSLLHRWDGVSLRWYASALANPGFREAALNSLLVAVAATALATGLGIAAALGLERASARHRPWAVVLLGLPLVVPEVVMAVATMVFFAQVPLFGQGIWRLVLAHACFCLPFALMPVRAALRGIEPALILAARDLYAAEANVLRHVTLPLLTPGIVAGAALAFIVSFDDFAMAQFVAGPGQTTLPVFIQAQLRRPLTPELNAMCMLMLGVSLSLVGLAMALLMRRGQAVFSGKDLQ